MEDYRARFVEIYNKNITRPGADRLLSWLETTDFFTAPASTRYHGACECGLVMHSLNVYDAMMQHFYTEGENAESYAICALLHDLCKANFYKVSTRNVKNDATGQWEKVPFYQVADQLPYGHGEKSVYLIEHFMRLKTDEAIAEEGLRAMEVWMQEIGLVLHSRELGVTEDMLDGIADGTFIMDGGYKKLDHAEIVQILKESL